eukprot:247613_1
MNIPLQDLSQKTFPEILDRTIPEARANVCAFNKWGTLLAVGTKWGTVEIFDMETLSSVKKITINSDPVSSIRWSRDGSRILIITARNCVTLHDMLSDLPVASQRFEETITGAVLDPRKRDVALISFVSAHPILFDFFTRKVIHSLMGPENMGRRQAQFDRSGQRTIVTSQRGDIFVLESKSKYFKTQNSISVSDKPIISTTFSECGRFCVINSIDGILRLYETERFSKIREFSSGNIKWRQCCFSPKAEYLICIPLEKDRTSAHIWRCSSGERVHVLECGRRILHAECHPTLCQLVTCHSDGALRVWNPYRNEHFAAFAPDFTELAENVVYDEREDEFDVEMDDAASLVIPISESSPVDLEGTDADDTQPLSSDDGQVMRYLPVIPRPDWSYRKDATQPIPAIQSPKPEQPQMMEAAPVTPVNLSQSSNQVVPVPHPPKQATHSYTADHLPVYNPPFEKPVSPQFPKPEIIEPPRSPRRPRRKRKKIIYSPEPLKPAKRPAHEPVPVSLKLVSTAESKSAEISSKQVKYEASHKSFSSVAQNIVSSHNLASRQSINGADKWSVKTDPQSRRTVQASSPQSDQPVLRVPQLQLALENLHQHASAKLEQPRSISSHQSHKSVTVGSESQQSMAIDTQFQQSTTTGLNSQQSPQSMTSGPYFQTSIPGPQPQPSLAIRPQFQLSMPNDPQLRQKVTTGQQSKQSMIARPQSQQSMGIGSRSTQSTITRPRSQQSLTTRPQFQQSLFPGEQSLQSMSTRPMSQQEIASHQLQMLQSQQSAFENLQSQASESLNQHSLTKSEPLVQQSMTHVPQSESTQSISTLSKPGASVQQSIFSKERSNSDGCQQSQSGLNVHQSFSPKQQSNCGVTLLRSQESKHNNISLDKSQYSVPQSEGNAYQIDNNCTPVSVQNHVQTTQHFQRPCGLFQSNHVTETAYSKRKIGKSAHPFRLNEVDKSRTSLFGYSSGKHKESETNTL